MAESEAPRFGSFLRAAGKLAAARQMSALLFIGAVLVLPALAPRGWVSDFVWAYFAMLTLTSLLGLGFERLSVTLTAEHGNTDRSPVGPLVLVRIVTIPVTAIALWMLLTFVGVALPVVAWCATLGWIVAALVSPIAFGALRARGDSNTEPRLIFGARLAQSVVLVTAAGSGATLTTALLGIAGIEIVAAAIAISVVGSELCFGRAFADVAGLPWRRATTLAGIEVVALAYLRADLLLVGRILGPMVGATYGMLYRVIDGLNGAVGSAGIWLYTESANARDGAGDPRGLRAQSLALLPRLAIGVGIVLILAGELLRDVVPRLGGETRTLQLLIVAFPLLTVNAVELHVRSGRGRNREVLGVGGAAFLLNVPLCLILVPAYGMRGAAVALVAAELLQTMLLLLASSTIERRLVARSMGVAGGGSLLLLLIGTGLDRVEPAVVLLGVAAAGAVVLWPFSRRARRTRRDALGIGVAPPRVSTETSG